MDNRGGIDIESWVTAIVGFTVCYVVWVTVTPAINNLHDVILTLGLPTKSITLAHLVQKVWNYGMIINAAGWLLFIVWSSIRVEVAESEYKVNL